MPKIADAAIAQAAIGAGFNGNPITSRTPAVLMTAIALGESSGNTDARNNVGAGHYGLWQISALHFKPDSVNWRDPATNASLAKKVWDQQGYKAWTVYTSQRYRVFIPRAIVAVQEATKGKFDAPGPEIPLPGPIEDAKNTLKDVQKLVDFLTDKNSWMRVGLFAVGATLLVIGVFKITGDNKLAEGTKSVIKTVATRGLNKVKP